MNVIEITVDRYNELIVKEHCYQILSDALDLIKDNEMFKYDSCKLEHIERVYKLLKREADNGA